jgi:hypothetical protein
MTYATALIGGYIVFALIGFASLPAQGARLSAPVAVDALAFSFGREVPHGASWIEAGGSAAHGWLIRQAYVHGRMEPNGTRYAEQVRKIGWPFTTVRGFIRAVDHDVQPVGAFFIRGDPAVGPVRFLPMQPVWPGLVVSGIWITLVLVLGRRLLSRGGNSGWESGG